MFLYNLQSIKYLLTTYPMLAGFKISSLPLDQWTISIKRHVETEYTKLLSRSVLTDPNVHQIAAHVRRALSAFFTRELSW